MKNIRGEFRILNNQLINSIEFLNTALPIDKTAYEVIKVVDSAPLFLTQHFKRLQESTQKSNIALNLTESDVIKSIKKLIVENNIFTGNIEILVSNNYTLFTFIPHSYPTADMYRNGIHVGFYYAERNNPTAKIKNTILRKKINKILKRKKIYEVLLVSKRGNISEGSRSNVMFIDKNNKIHTAPDSQVLKGITRQTVLDICEKMKFEVITEPINKRMLNSFQAAFITGTSPGVIPIKSIGNINFSITNQTLQSILSKFQKIESENLKNGVLITDNNN